MTTTSTQETFGSDATVLVSIQWLRAIAAVFVVIFHTLYYSNTLTEQFGQPPIKTPGFAWMTQDLHPSGSLGDARLATAEKGEASLQQGAQAFVELLREIDSFDLSRLKDGPLDK